MNLESTEESYNIVYEEFLKVPGWQDVLKGMIKNPFIQEPYGEKNVARLIQDIAIIEDIMNSEDNECTILRNRPEELHRRDLVYNTTDTKLKQQYVDFKVGSWSIEYKCPFFATSAKIAQIKANWGLTSGINEINSTRRIRVININYDWIDQVCSRVITLFRVNTQLKQLLADLTVTKRINTRNKSYSSFLYPDDINHSVINEILIKYYNHDPEDIDKIVKEFEDELGFEKFNFNPGKEQSEKDWKELLKNLLKQTGKGHEFFKKNVLLTEDIVDEIPIEKEFNANTFNRNNQFKKRLKMIMNVLPDRRYMDLKEMGDTENLKYLMEIIEEKYLEGIYEPMSVILDNFDEYKQLKVMSELYYEKKSEEKTVIAEQDVQKVRLADIWERRKDLMEEMGIDITNETDFKNKIQELREKFKTKKTLHCSIKSFVKEKEKNRNIITPKPVAEIKDYENLIESLIEKHRKNKLDDLNHPLLNITEESKIYGNEDLNYLCTNLIKMSTEKIKEKRETNIWNILSEQDDILTNIMINMIKSVKAAKREDFIVLYHENYGYYSISFRATEISTGPILYFGAFTGDSHFSELYPEYFYKRDEEKDITYFVTKPFSLQMQILKTQKEIKYKWLLKVLEYEEYDIDLSKNTLFNSLFFQQNSNVQSAIMLMYNLYKNYNQIGNMGKNKAAKKLETKGICDARLATVIYRLKNNWRDFIQNIQDNNKRGKNILMNVEEVIDPIFLFEHKSLETVFGIQFFKALLPKNEGIDVYHYMSKQMAEELVHKQDYYNSKSKKRQEEGRQDVTIEEFYTELFSEDYSDWEQIAWHPDTIIKSMNRMLDISEKINTKPALRSKINEYKNQELMKDTKTTSINSVKNETLEDEMMKYITNNKKNFQNKAEFCQ